MASDSGMVISVAMLIQRYYPHLGGAENQLRSLVPLLRARGISVVVLTRAATCSPLVDRVDGATVFRLPVGGGKLAAGLAYVVGALAVLRRLRRRIDVLHAHELLSPATAGVVAKYLSGQPLVVKVLRGGQLSDLRALRRRPLGAARWGLYRRSVDSFIAISREIERELLGAGVPSSRLVRIPNGVDTTRFIPVGTGQQRCEVRRRLGLDDAPTAVYTGRLAREKRVDVLVGVWPRVRARVPAAQLLVVGEGPLETELRRLRSAGVVLVGRQESVLPYLQASDVFVLPSIAEGLSNAMLEAMACGLACLVHRHGGAADVLEDGYSGCFLPDATEDALVQSLVRLLQDRTTCARLGARARRRVIEAYSLEATADALAALYRTLLSSRSHNRVFPAKLWS